MTHPQEQQPELPFSDAAIEQLATALRLFLTTGEAERHEELQRAIDRLCTQAHDARVGPERLLVVVKTAWQRIQMNERIDPTRARVAFDRVIGVCLDAYYRDAG